MLTASSLITDHDESLVVAGGFLQFAFVLVGHAVGAADFVRTSRLLCVH